MKYAKRCMWGFALCGVFTCMINLNANAQYKTAIGMRIGGTSGVSLKHFYRPNTAVEGLLGAFGYGFSLTGLIERQVPFNVDGLHFYYGGGVHMAFYNDHDHYDRFGRELDYRVHNSTGFGIDGIIGIEYKLPDNIPMAISMDLKPFIEVGSNSGYVGFAPDPSIGIKFTIR